MECGVCFQEVRVLKKLPCNHNFCVQCVENLVKFAPDDFLKCPMCRYEVQQLADISMLFTGRMKCSVCLHDFPVQGIFWLQSSADLLCGICIGDSAGDGIHAWNTLRAIDDCCRFFEKLEKIPPIPKISLCQTLRELYDRPILVENSDEFHFDVKKFDNYLFVAREAVKVATEEGAFQKIWKNFDPSTVGVHAASKSLSRVEFPREELLGLFVPVCHLVNPAGYNISLGAENKGTFYCDRYLSHTRIEEDSGGRCGPHEGPQCRDCKSFSPLNSAGVPVKPCVTETVQFFCNMEFADKVCSSHSGFQCELCKQFDKNPAGAMAKGISWRLKRDLILTNAILEFVKFDQVANLPYCGVESVSKFYGLQKCDKETGRCVACSNAVFLNSAGFPVTPGTEERTKHNFYCGRYLNPAALPGSDGFCGPNNGPQCADCLEFQANPSESMRKGFQTLLFLLQHEQPLVNRVGFPLTPGTDLLYFESGCGNFYCGRYVGVGALPGSDGRCGSNNGPQCDDCKDFCPRNEAGVAVKPGRLDFHGLFYCGRNVGVHEIPGSNGRCGPNNGPQCRECKIFQRNPGLAMRKGLIAGKNQKKAK